MARIGFVGAGSYGTAVANHLAQKGEDVILYARNPDVVDEINSAHTNSRYLGNSALSPNLLATHTLGEAVADAEYVFLSVPAQQMRAVARSCKPHLDLSARVINLAKGIEVSTFKRMSEVIESEIGSSYDIMTLSGPSFSRDIVSPSGSVAVCLAGTHSRAVSETRDMLHTLDFQVFGTPDIVGVEFGGSLKNVYAIMAGMIKGCGEGDSFLGAYIPRATVELDTIARFFGASRDTSRGLAVEGDLIITCTENSRNFRFGKLYAEHFNGNNNASLQIAYAKLGNNTVEGYHTLKAMQQFVTDHNMFAPIVRESFDILYGTKSPRDAIRAFREQDSTREWESRRTISKVLHSAAPKWWYRRENLSFSGILKEVKKRIKL